MLSSDDYQELTPAGQLLHRILSSHGYADSDVYGQCFCGEIHEDSGDMATHIMEKMREAGLK